MRTSTANNASAYGYSLVGTGSFGALEKVRGAPSWAELFAFLIGACLTFAAVNAASTRLYQEESPSEPELVVSLATSLSVFSVSTAVATAAGVAWLVPGWPAWPATSVTFTLAYVLAVGVELGLAAHRHPAGGVEAERRREAAGERA